MPRIDELFSVAGQGVIVTGAASGIGFAIAEVLAENGARLGLIDIAPDALDAAAGRLARFGNQVETHVADLTDRAAAFAALDALHNRLGRLDTVFANAGVSGGPGFLDATGKRPPERRFENIDPAVLDRVLKVNIAASFYTIQAAVPHMRAAGGGHIVVTSSISAHKTETIVGAAYVASKGGTGMLVRQAAHELAADRITVNAIAPGPIVTNIGGGRLHDMATQELVGRFTPLGRIGTPADLQGAAIFLASRASDHMTGAEIVIDGGTTLGPVVIPPPAA